MNLLCLQKDSSGQTLPRTLRKRELHAPGCPFFIKRIFIDKWYVQGPSHAMLAANNGPKNCPSVAPAPIKPNNL